LVIAVITLVGTIASHLPEHLIKDKSRTKRRQFHYHSGAGERGRIV
jgi:hypothetical protein